MKPRPPLFRPAATDLVRSSRTGAIWRRFALAPHLDLQFGRLTEVVRKLDYGLIVDHFDLYISRIAGPTGDLLGAPPGDVMLAAVFRALPPEETP